MASGPWDKYKSDVSPSTTSGPWDKYKAPVQPVGTTTEEPGQLESALRGIEQGATLGWEAPINGALETAGNALTGNTQGKSLLDLYRQHRDESKQLNDASRQAHPITSFGANLVGGAIPAFLTGGGTEALTGADALEQAALVGGKYGAVAGLGGSNADLTKGEIGKALDDTLSGAAMGAVTGAALQKLLPGEEALKTNRNEQLTKNAGLTKGQQSELAAKGRLQSVGQTAFENKIGTLGVNPEESMENARQALATHGGTIGDIATGLDNQFEHLPSEIQNKFWNPANTANTLETQMLEPRMELQSNKTVRDRIQQIAEDLRTISPESTGSEPVSFQDAQRIKTAIGKDIDWSRNASPAEKAAQQAYGIITGDIDNSLEQVAQNSGNPDLFNDFVKAKEDFGNSKSLLEGSIRKQGQEFSNRAIGLTDYIAGAAGLAGQGNPITALGMAAANKIVRTHGNAINAALSEAGRRYIYELPKQTLDNLGTTLLTSQSQVGKSLGNIFKEAAQRDDIGRNALLFSTMQIPAYREFLNPHTEEKK